jgi:hypothetical protein
MEDYKVGDKVIVHDRISDDVGELDYLHDKAGYILTIDRITIDEGVKIYHISEYNIDCIAADFDRVLTENEIRCQHCVHLYELEGEWRCDAVNDAVNNIIDCPYDCDEDFIDK